MTKEQFEKAGEITRMIKEKNEHLSEAEDRLKHVRESPARSSIYAGTTSKRIDITEDLPLSSEQLLVIAIDTIKRRIYELESQLASI